MAENVDLQNTETPASLESAQRPSPAARRFAALRLGDRFKATRWLQASTALVFLWFAAVGAVPPVEALIGYMVISVAALTVPRRPRAKRAADEAALAAEQAMDATTTRLAEALDLPCIVIDERSVVRHINTSGARQFPRTGQGVPLSFSLRQPALVAAIEACRRTRASQSIEVNQTAPNAAWFRVHVAPFAPAVGSDAPPRNWLVITFTDITEQRRIDTMRSDFVANASHELRTPLTSLVGFIETLQGPAARDADARERFLGIMAQQAARMSRLIDDLLSLSRIESRQHLAPSGTVDLSNLLREVCEALGPQAREAGLSFDMDLHDTPANVVGERSELFEVFENLVDNAIKYGGGDRITLRLTPARQHPSYAWSATVTDYGEGIASEHVPRLTERFYRVDAESSRRKKGTGLGLAIVKHIVNRHRGTMAVRSRLGEGTTVEVLLPG